MNFHKSIVLPLRCRSAGPPSLYCLHGDKLLFPPGNFLDSSFENHSLRFTLGQLLLTMVMSRFRKMKKFRYSYKNYDKVINTIKSEIKFDLIFQADKFSYRFVIDCLAVWVKCHVLKGTPWIILWLYTITYRKCSLWEGFFIAVSIVRPGTCPLSNGFHSD